MKAAASTLPRSALPLLACPSCRKSLRADALGALHCDACRVAYPTTNGVTALRIAAPEDAVGSRVRGFYAAAPFPNYPPRDSWSALRLRAERSQWAQTLDRAIAPDARVLELGCGTGQMALYLARADRFVVGADFTRASLELAAAAARRYGTTRVQFVETDLHSPGLAEGAFDVVYCSGVLHHTPDPAAAFARIAPLVRPGGVLVVGLYNVYARLPHRLRRTIARLCGFRFIPFDPVLRDRQAEPARRQAWLRDQYHHPEEHRHTVAEVRRWFARAGLTFCRTVPESLVAVEPPPDEALFSPAEDDWGFEALLAQLGWVRSIAAEGGLFMSIGRRDGAAANGEERWRS